MCVEGVFLLWEWSWQLEIGHGIVVVGGTLTGIIILFLNNQSTMIIGK